MVWATGSNTYGQLGLGSDLKETEVAMKIKSLKHIVQVHCGQNFSICMDIDGAVFVFGQNNQGQLGTGNPEMDRFCVPIKIPAFSVGQSTAIALRTIKCGMNHICCLDKEGRAYSFGCNKYGRCGHPEDEKQLFSPKLIDIESGAEHESNEEVKDERDTIVDIFCGNFHTILLTKSGDYYCFGANDYGQCSTENQAKAIAIPYKVSRKELNIKGTIADVVCGFDTTVLIIQ